MAAEQQFYKTLGIENPRLTSGDSSKRTRDERAKSSDDGRPTKKQNGKTDASSGLGEERSMPHSSDGGPDSSVAAPVPEKLSEIRFRLNCSDIPVNKKTVFNAPRNSEIRRVRPFLERWLTDKKIGAGKVLKFRHNGKFVDDSVTFLELFGKTVGTQIEPAILNFGLE